MTPAERDRHLEDWLDGQGHQGAPSRARAGCLDAERAAAWLDGHLTASELQSAQAHVAGCAACQTLLQSLMEAELAADAAPHTAPPVRPVPAAADEARPRAPWVRWFTWGAPLGVAAAAVLAVAVWVRTPAPALQPEPSSGLSVAMPVGRPPGAVAERRDNATAPAKTAESTRIEAPAPPAESSPAPQVMAKAVQAPTAGEPAADNRVQGGLVGGVTGGVVGALAAPPPPPPPPPAAPAPPPPASALAAAPPPAAASGALLRERASADAALARPTSFEVRGPTGQERWRVTGTQIERSVDGGQSWADLSPSAGLPLTSGSAPAPGTCWFVGRGGTVLVFTEPAGLVRLAFPLAVDLARVAAASGREARVETVDGRRFRTSDGGRTWQAEP